MTNRIPDPYQVTEWLFAALGLFFNAVIMILFWLFADIDDSDKSSLPIFYICFVGIFLDQIAGLIFHIIEFTRCRAFLQFILKSVAFFVLLAHLKGKRKPLDFFITCFTIVKIFFEWLHQLFVYPLTLTYSLKTQQPAQTEEMFDEGFSRKLSAYIDQFYIRIPPVYKTIPKVEWMSADRRGSNGNKKAGFRIKYETKTGSAVQIEVPYANVDKTKTVPVPEVSNEIVCINIPLLRPN